MSDETPFLPAPGPSGDLFAQSGPTPFGEPEPNDAEAIRLEGVHKSFGDLPVLRGIDLSVAPHEVICLIGSSGSGKSTLLRCVNLLEPVNKGRIVLWGQDVTSAGVDENAVRRHIGIVFQSFNLFPHMTVLAQHHPRAYPGPRRYRGREAESPRLCPARPIRALGQKGRLPRPALGWPAATRRHRPGSGHAAGDHALGRGHERT